MDAIHEITARRTNGFLALFLILILWGIGAWLLVHLIRTQEFMLFWVEGPLLIAASIALGGFYVVQPNEARVEGQASLRGNPGEVSDILRIQVEARLEVAGVEISEARISHLAYAAEIAQAMLRRQQAEAIVAARQKIVEGAVGMVESALKMLSDQNVITLDDERKASMINNVLVALVSEHDMQPVINTGTLYS